MSSRPDAALLAVLATLVRATADARAPVVLRASRPAQARALANWLSRVHGSRRTVVASVSVPAAVEVHLPARVAWPPCAAVRPALARSGTGDHFSRMNSHRPDRGDR